MSEDSYSDKLRKKVERQRLARKEAEKLLEQKSLELFHVNQDLERTMEELEQRVLDRTAELESILVQVKQKSTELALMNSVIASVSAATNLDDCLEIVVNTILQLEGVGKVGIALVSETDESLIALNEKYSANQSHTLVGEIFELQTNIQAKLVLDSKKRLLVADILESNEGVAINYLLEKEGIFSLAIFPILVNEKVIGAVSVAIMELGVNVSEDQLNFMESIILQASGAIQNHLLWKQQQISLKEIGAKKEQLELANKVIENSPVILIRWRPEPKMPVEYISSNIQQFAYDAEDFIEGKINLSDIIHKAHLNRILEEIQNNLDQGLEEYKLEYEIVGNDSQIYWVEARNKIIRDASGNHLYNESTLFDITDRVFAEERAKLAQFSIDNTAQMI
ncbi:MAG: PAS domain-containing protein, partial [Chloroflexota bacterium]